MGRRVLLISSLRPIPADATGVLESLGVTAIWEVTPTQWRVYFDRAPEGIDAALAAAGLPVETDWTQEEDVDWAARYQASLKPLAMGRRFTVLPAPDHTNPWPGRMPLKLFPGMAFGTGEHYTTSSSLAVMEALLPFPDSVLDVGCGSGILSVAARMLGASRVVGCDVDGDACRVAAQTAELNGTPYRVVHGSASAVRGRFRLVLANILSEILVEIMPDLDARVEADGILVCSGVTCEKGDSVLKAAGAFGLTASKRRTDGEWWTFVFHRTR